MKKEALWMLSNIAAGTAQQVIQIVMADMLPVLIQIVESGVEEYIKEAVWSINNLTTIKDFSVLEKALSQGLLELICSLLKMEDPKILAVSLEGLMNLLNAGRQEDGSNALVLKIEKLGMFDRLEGLLYHRTQMVYEKAIKIIEAHLEAEVDNDDI